MFGDVLVWGKAVFACGDEQVADLSIVHVIELAAAAAVWWALGPEQQCRVVELLGCDYRTVNAGDEPGRGLGQTAHGHLPDRGGVYLGIVVGDQMELHQTRCAAAPFDAHLVPVGVTDESDFDQSAVPGRTCPSRVGCSRG